MFTTKKIVAAVVILIAIAGAVASSTAVRHSLKNDLWSNDLQNGHSRFVSLTSEIKNAPLPNSNEIKFPPLPEFEQNALKYLADAQLDNGGWGAGFHYAQDVRDPHAVPADAATTAFVAMSLIRSGNTHESGPYAANIKKALLYLLDVVEKSPDNTATLIDVTNTQPQVKLGQNIDASMTSQFLSRMLDLMLQNDPLRQRVADANAKCLKKIQGQLNNDGSVTGAGWAGVLQSSMANQAIERAVNSDAITDQSVVDGATKSLQQTQDYQWQNVDAGTGAIRTDASAGVELYSVTSTTRATAIPAKEAQDIVIKGKKEGKIKDDKVTKENLQELGINATDADRYQQAYDVNQQAKAQLQNDELLNGFGNNGGEEYLSYMMTSESLVISGGDDWDNWNKKMHDRLSTIQNSDGSWTGMHCITSPVFCTAAVIMTLTADHDANFLMKKSANN